MIYNNRCEFNSINTCRNKIKNQNQTDNKTVVKPSTEIRTIRTPSTHMEDIVRTTDTYSNRFMQNVMSNARLVKFNSVQLFK